MPLFNKRVLDRHTKHIHIDAGHIETLKKWAENLSAGVYDVETQSDSEFIQQILIGVLGYTGSSGGKQWTVAKNQPIGNGNVDVALGHFTPDSAAIIAPFELKGAKTRDLDAAIPTRDAKGHMRYRSPVQQAWEYAMDAKGTKWVLVSNYREIRLYAFGYGRKDYESFDLECMADDSQYKRFMLLLSARHLLDGQTLSLLKESEQAEKDITNELYGRYKALRTSIIGAIYSENPEKNKLDVIRCAQTIMDRILFVAFAEDKGLLPDKMLAKAFEAENRFYPLPKWENFKKLFSAINEGDNGLEINGYNGGLFSTMLR